MSLLLLQLAVSGVAATLAAAAGERALRELGMPARSVWIAALVGSASISVLFLAGGSLPFALPVELAELLRTSGSDGGARGVRSASLAGYSYTGALAVGWLAISMLLLGRLAVGLVQQTRRIAAGHAARLDGTEVTVCRDFGPAAVGMLRPRIVIPEWLLSHPEEERELVVRHEAEHVAARDPLLAGAALLILCLVPWNPLLWYQTCRLRDAIEMDCDARVIGGEPGRVHRYGALLIELAGRSVGLATPGTAWNGPRSSLERRVRTMTRSDRGTRVAIVWAGAALVLALAACADVAGPAVDRNGAPTTPREVRLVPMIDGTVTPEQALSTTLRLQADDRPIKGR